MVTRRDSMERTLLLVDDEENILRSLKRLLRRDGYNILTASGGAQGLEILRSNDVGVIISDQRMPEMSGVEFLSKVKETYPDNVRMVLSGYTDLNSVTDAINKGAIYKFLTKPWDDGLLLKHVTDAFVHFELARENKRLTIALEQANKKLENTNIELKKDNKQISQLAEVNLNVLKLTQDIFESFPLGVIGVGIDGMIAVANHKSLELLSPEQSAIVGFFCDDLLSNELLLLLDKCSKSGQTVANQITLKGSILVDVTVCPLYNGDNVRGSLMVLNPLSPNR